MKAHERDSAAVRERALNLAVLHFKDRRLNLGSQDLLDCAREFEKFLDASTSGADFWRRTMVLELAPSMPQEAYDFIIGHAAAKPNRRSWVAF